MILTHFRSRPNTKVYIMEVMIMNLMIGIEVPCSMAGYVVMIQTVPGLMNGLDAMTTVLNQTKSR